MAGLREGATLPRGRFARYSPILAVLFALGGAALIANGVTGSGAASQRLLGMAGGAVLVFLARRHDGALRRAARSRASSARRWPGARAARWRATTPCATPRAPRAPPPRS